MDKKHSLFASQFDSLKEKVIHAAERDGIDLLEDGVIEQLLTISEGVNTFDGKPNEDWESATWAERIFAIAFRCSTADIANDSEESLIESLCLGNWAVGFVDGLPGDAPPSDTCIPCIIKQHVSAIGKHAVSQREDQILKANWQKHVSRCVDENIVINNLKDLLEVTGYDEKLCRVQPVTLKAWAKEAVPTLKFKAGRPR